LNQFNSNDATESVKHYRREHGLSQRELANLVGISDSSVLNWERALVTKLSPQAEKLFAFVGYKYETAPPTTEVSSKGDVDDSYFNKGSISLDGDLLAFVIHMAVGDRSVDEISTLSGIHKDFFAYLMIGKVTKQPSVNVLGRLAQYAKNGITKDILMYASGYLVDDVDLSPLERAYHAWKHPIDGDSKVALRRSGLELQNAQLMNYVMTKWDKEKTTK
jgi:transcriptional regulator with XRE-family HTH domain